MVIVTLPAVTSALIEPPVDAELLYGQSVVRGKMMMQGRRRLVQVLIQVGGVADV